MPFAELVIHRIEEEDIDIKEAVNRAVVKRFSDELDHERILTADQLANDQDMGVQQKVAGPWSSSTCSAPIGRSATRFTPWWSATNCLSLLEDSFVGCT